MTTLLRAQGLVVRPGPSGFELRIPELALAGSETLAVLGPNGAGKSTLLRALAGLEPLAEGSVDGPGRGAVAMVFQRPLVLVGSVEHNVRVALWGRGLARAEVAKRVARELERFGISGLARRSAHTLSGGETRRLALARAFAQEPAVLLLDEPFDDLDTEGREALSLDVERAIAQTRVAVAVVTHDLGLALLLADRLAILRAGRLRQVGERDAVLRRPCHREVAELVGMTNLVEGRVEERLPERCVLVRVDADHAIVARGECPPGARVLVGVRPEHLKLDVGRGEGRSIGKGSVSRVRSDGMLVAVSIDWAGTTLRTHLLAGRGLGSRLRAGDAVSLRVRPEDAHLMAPEVR